MLKKPTHNYSLVKFDDQSLCIIPSKRVNLSSKTGCIVKYLGGAKYSAELIESSDSVDHLNNRQEELEKIQQNKLQNHTKGLTNQNSKKEASIKNQKSNSVPKGSNQNQSCSAPVTNLANGSILQGFESSFDPPSSSSPSLQPNEICSTNPIGSLMSEQHLDTFTVNLTYDKTESSAAISGYTDELQELGPHWPDSFDNDDVLVNLNDNFIVNADELILLAEKENFISNSNIEIQQTTPTLKKSLLVNSNKDKVSYQNDDLQLNDVSYNPGTTANNTEDTVEESNVSIDPEPLTLSKKPIDLSKITIPLSGKRFEKSKKHFCIFCKELKTKFSDHILRVHSDNEEVKSIIFLKKGSLIRKRKIAAIRARGDHLHNTDPDYNTNIFILPRRNNKNSINKAEDFVACRTCGQLFSKSSVRFHVKKCGKNDLIRNVRDVKKSGRAVTGFIHPAACQLLREEIFPVLTDDDVVKCIKYDELIIKYGNKLSYNYTLKHQHDMIRSKLRLLGKFKLKMTIIQKDPSLQLQDMFVPSLYNRCIEALRDVATWDMSEGKFKHPVTAQSLSALIKATCVMARSEFIKSGEADKEKQAERFLHLWKEEVPVLINKKATEDLANLKREKQVILPTKADIKHLYDYLKNECEQCLKILDENFNLKAWELLTQCSLIFIQIFNRRRAGEIERLTVNNFINKTNLNDNIDPHLLNNFQEKTIDCSRQFVRLILRGKLSRTVSVLLSPFMILCVETILKFRKDAGVKSDNEYIFSVPGDSRLSKKYIRACPLMKRFADDCGAAVPQSLRGTYLRKHIATHTALMNVEDCQVDQLANFMGHSRDIHKNIYRVPIPITEITQVSRLLNAAIGNEDDDDDGGGEDDDNEQLIEHESINKGELLKKNKPSGSKQQQKSKRSNRIISESSDDSDDSFNDNNDGYDADEGVEEHMDSQSQATTSKKRKSTLKNKITRRRWTADEKIAVEQQFGNIGKTTKLPSLSECLTCIKTHPVLNTRTPAQIKAYISNIRSGTKFS